MLFVFSFFLARWTKKHKHTKDWTKVPCYFPAVQLKLQFFVRWLLGVCLSQYCTAQNVPMGYIGYVQWKTHSMNAENCQNNNNNNKPHNHSVPVHMCTWLPGWISLFTWPADGTGINISFISSLLLSLPLSYDWFYIMAKNILPDTVKYKVA